MKNSILYLVLVLCGVCAVSCASRKQKINYTQQSVLITPGMSKQDVIDIMGYPGNNQFNGNNEAWQYHRNGFWQGYDKIFIVWFYKGYVTGLTTYDMPTTGAAVYKSIRWEERPDDIIEIRHR